jgi:hypothetical protein
VGESCEAARERRKGMSPRKTEIKILHFSGHQDRPMHSLSCELDVKLCVGTHHVIILLAEMREILETSQYILCQMAYISFGGFEPTTPVPSLSVRSSTYPYTKASKRQYCQPNRRVHHSRRTQLTKYRCLSIHNCRTCNIDPPTV